MSCHRKAFQTFVMVVLFIPLPAPKKACGAEGENSDLNLEKIPPWEKIFNLRTWSGYNDNWLFSHERALERPFLAAGLDFLLWRLPDNGWEYLLIGSGDYIRYIPAQPVDKEANALV